MDEFLRTLHSGRADNRLINASMVEGIPEFGGYSVPEEYGAFLMDKSLENEIIRPRAKQYGQWEAKQRKVTSLRWSRQNQSPIRRYFRRMAGGKVRQAHERPPS